MTIDLINKYQLKITYTLGVHTCASSILFIIHYGLYSNKITSVLVASNKKELCSSSGCVRSNFGGDFFLFWKSQQNIEADNLLIFLTKTLDSDIISGFILNNVLLTQ